MLSWSVLWYDRTLSGIGNCTKSPPILHSVGTSGIFLTKKPSSRNTTMLTTRNNRTQMARALFLASSIAVLAPLLASGQIRAQPMDQPRQGLVLARQICAQCHAVEPGSLNSPNPAAPRFDVIANIPGMTATAISATLNTSHRTMPNVILDSDQAGAIIAYLLSLKRAAR
jgi:mono/diheme cytochrome c family protein